jgi:hypothetical protein
MHLCTYRSLNHILIVYSSNVTNRPSLTRYVAYIARGVDLCQTLGGPNPFPPRPYPLPLLHPFPSSLLLLPFVPPFSSLPSPSSPLPLLWGSGAYAPGKIFSGTHMLAREF